MLPTNLNNYEVKNNIGAAVAFSRRSNWENKVVFISDESTPRLPTELSVAHTITGTGLNSRRRSAARLDRSVQLLEGTSYETRIAKCSFYCVSDIPIGCMDTYDEAIMAGALLGSFMFLAPHSTNAVFKFDGTSTGFAALINGTL